MTKHFPYKQTLIALALTAVPTLAQTIDGGMSKFTSTNTAITKSYNWARKTALSYAHDSNDAVGPWYEAALPNREAFCMRDVSHQVVGAHLLGLERQNKNMHTHFVENISESRDYCSYWEINRYNKPCPADYANDHSFWYNLDANFDVLISDYKLYQWTADEDYIKAKAFANFHKLTTHQYLERWMLEPEQVMHRPLLLNDKVTREQGNNFYGCRGIPSYTEGIPRLTMSADLLAIISNAMKAYAEMCTMEDNEQEARQARAKSEQYSEIIESQWWDAKNNRYNMLVNDSGQFHSQQGMEFLLHYPITTRAERINSCLDHFETRPQAIEQISYQPALLYRYNRAHAADSLIALFPDMPRALYPEVSYALIEGVVTGLMGVEPDAQHRILSTVYRGDDNDKAELTDVLLWGGKIDLSHDGKLASRLTNNTGARLTWIVKFAGKHRNIYINGRRRKAVRMMDELGKAYSKVKVQIPANQTAEASLRK